MTRDQFLRFVVVVVLLSLAFVGTFLWGWASKEHDCGLTRQMVEIRADFIDHRDVEGATLEGSSLDQQITDNIIRGFMDCTERS